MLKKTLLQAITSIHFPNFLQSFHNCTENVVQKVMIIHCLYRLDEYTVLMVKIPFCHDGTKFIAYLWFYHPDLCNFLAVCSLSSGTNYWYKTGWITEQTILCFSPGPLHFEKCTNTPLKIDASCAQNSGDDGWIYFGLCPYTSKGKHIISKSHQSPTFKSNSYCFRFVTHCCFKYSFREVWNILGAVVKGT